MPEFTIKEIAEHIAGTVIGDEKAIISQPCGLTEATAGSITFLANPKYAPALASTKATAAIVDKNTDTAPCTLIQVDNPDLSFSMAVGLLAGPNPLPKVGINAAANISDKATIGKDVRIAAGVVIEAGATIGDNTTIFANAYIGHESSVGNDCTIFPSVVIYHKITIGDRVSIHANTVIGSDGFGYAWDGAKHAKIPQVGTIVISDDVEIGANSVIDRARFGKTLIGPGTKIDNLVQIAHNVEIGAHSIIVAQVGISGSTKIGNGVVAGGQVGIAGHLNIGDGALLAAQSGVIKDVPAGAKFNGTPAIDMKEWMDKQRNLKVVKRLRATIKDLEARMERLENETTNNS